MASVDSLTSAAVRPPAAGLLSALADAGIGDLLALTARGFGAIVTDHRSSWVRRVTLPGRGELYVKTYAYPTVAERWKGAFRTTFLAPSRAAREADALAWLAAAGFPGPRALGVFERRRYGWLELAVLVTEAWPGAQDLDHLLPHLGPDERARCCAALLAFVTRLHARGFRDGNFDLRNVLGRRAADGRFELAKIDSPKWRLTRPGPREDRATRADHARIARSLATLGIPAPWAAAGTHAG